MARVTYVTSARRRCFTTGENKGKQKPYEKCEVCGKEIEPGMPYKWVEPKISPTYSVRHVRCHDCPTWQPWELSNALWARIAQIQSEAQGVDTSDPDEVRSALETAADQIEELASEKRDGASNIEEGFGHPTSLSEELEATADALEQWANEVREKAGEIEEAVEEEVECESCEGSGVITTTMGSELECPDCSGTGSVENPDLEDAASVLEEALSILEESPV